MKERREKNLLLSFLNYIPNFLVISKLTILGSPGVSVLAKLLKIPANPRLFIGAASSVMLETLKIILKLSSKLSKIILAPAVEKDPTLYLSLIHI